MNSRRPRARSLLLFLGFAVAPVGSVHGNSWYPNPGHTGAPGHITCATSGCHPSTPGNGSVQVQLDGASEYTAGALHTLMVTVTDPQQIRFGFSIVARDTDDNLVDVGTFGVVPGWETWTQTFLTGTSTISHQNGPYTSDGAGYDPDTGSYTFPIQWTAPQQGVGEVTFYAAGLAADGNADQFGDFVYTTSLTVGEASVQPPPSIADLMVLPDGKARFTLTGEADASYMIQYLTGGSPPWTDLEEVLLDSGDSKTFIDQTAVGVPTRTYRATSGGP